MTNINKYMDSAKRVFEIEGEQIIRLSNKLTEDFIGAIDTIKQSKGRVVVCGMGKSGIIGKKIAATLASTGTPSFFMHPAEAYHGDLGMVTVDDVFLAMSNSGETEEVIKLIPFLKNNGNKLISLTGNSTSTLATESDFVLDISVDHEACPLQLAPTASTAATLAMGDAIAVTLMQSKNFMPENFARFHPGGALGRLLLSTVGSEMHTDNLPIITLETSLKDLIFIMSAGGLGLTFLKDGSGIVTDGDLRRAIEKYGERIFSQTAKDLMTKKPISINSSARVQDAISLMTEKRINSIIVIDKDVVVGVFKK